MTAPTSLRSGASLRLLATAWLWLPLICGATGGCALDDERQQIGAGGYDFVLQINTAGSCLGDASRDKDTLVGRFDTTLEEGDGTQDGIGRAESALKLLADYAEGRAAAAGARNADWLALSQAMAASRASLQAIRPDASPAEQQEGASKAIPRAWSEIARAPQGEFAAGDRRVLLLAPTGCANTDPACPPYEAQRDMIRVVNLAARLRGLTQRPGFLLHLADARLQNARWDAYREKGQHQYFWEVWINGATMGQECAKDPRTDIQLGFCKVPTRQFIVLHPEAGVRWVRSATRSSELRPAFIVELIGAYRWDWQSETSAEPKNRLGASLIAAYADANGGQRWSYGPMLHIGSGYNLALTRGAGSGQQWSVAVSLNLAERYFGRRQEALDYLKNPAKPGLAKLLE